MLAYRTGTVVISAEGSCNHAIMHCLSSFLSIKVVPCRTQSMHTCTVANSPRYVHNSTSLYRGSVHVVDD